MAKATVFRCVVLILARAVSLPLNLSWLFTQSYLLTLWKAPRNSKDN